ncbi:unnamed protein product [Closterium sp. Naga37s-1]|nr:unnamed protein product [Closterium sp. Naga37s-1]
MSVRKRTWCVVNRVKKANNLGACTHPAMSAGQCVSAGPGWGPIFYSSGVASGAIKAEDMCQRCACNKGQFSNCRRIKGRFQSHRLTRPSRFLISLLALVFVLPPSAAHNTMVRHGMPVCVPEKGAGAVAAQCDACCKGAEGDANVKACLAACGRVTL